jgi:hypothetical protein
MLTTSSGSTVSESNEGDRGGHGDRDWVQAHEALSLLARKRAALDAEEGRWLLVALRTAAHVHLGFGSFGEYIERLFGYKPRSTQEKLRVAEALEELPATAAELESGALSWSAVRELTRVAVPDTEQGWIEVARGKTVHQLEAIVAGKERGATPSSSPSPEVRRHVLRFEVAAETFCVFRDAADKLQRDSGSSLDDDSALLLMARHVLGGPSNEGRASYQIALSVCPACSQGYQQAGGELVPVGADIVAMGECDGQHLGLVSAGAGERADSSEFAEGEVGAGVHTDDAHVGACSQGKVSVHTDAAHTGACSEAKVSVHTDDVHVGARAGRAASGGLGAHSSSRAKQTISPATRRSVLRRDQHRCSVPGCRNATYVDLHHLRLRSEGGSNRASNLVTLCGVHHRAAHRGELLVTASVAEEGGRVAQGVNLAEGVRFRHADGSDYGSAPDARVVEVRAKAFAALRNLGFREGETRRVLGEVCKNVGAQAPSLERVVRDALAQLSSPNQVAAGASKLRQS